MPSSKKKDRHVKSSSGVVAAVTKHAAKFSNSGDEDATPGSDSPPSPILSPEMPPTEPETIPIRDSEPDVASSPLLDAVPGPRATLANSPSSGDLFRNQGALAGSPHLISIMGESPPTNPSSYEDHRMPPSAWTTQRQHVNNFAPSASPPTSGSARRPLSFQLDSQYPGYDVRSQASSPPGARRSSMHSPLAQPRLASHPPLPHQPQAHFYGAPEIDFDMNPKAGLKPGQRGYYFGFDTWPTSKFSHHSGTNSVVLAGYEGGLDIYAVSKRGIEPLTSLKGLRGGVHHAKILPWNGLGGETDGYPLIAVVIHGPVLPTQTPDISVETHYDAGSSPRMDGLNAPQPDTNHRPAAAAKATPSIDAYQTTVDIYSLKDNSLVHTLLLAPIVPVKTSITSPVFRSPPPSGALQIRADDGSVVVSSGTTGECWIFRQADKSATNGFDFRCLGKVWTTLQHPIKGDMPPEEEGSRSPVSRQNPQSPILSVNGRWLAYCPPAASSQIALNATVGVTIEGRAPGLATLTSPVLPSETSEVDQPLSDGMMNRIMRETTQEVIQGAKWVGKHGMQLWNNYMNKPGQTPQGRPAPVGSPPWGQSYPGRSDQAAFPPTYGVSGQAVTKDPGLVSILDLGSLEFSSSLHHITTFKAPLGCSFVSFSPTGLSLFTASGKGDVQTVWDLMRVHYTKSSSLQNYQQSSGPSARVRQTAQFSRMTVARIVDVAWAKPNGERLAMVTERGTVHLLDLPPSAFTWPPPRKRANPEDPKAATAETTSAMGMASNAMTTVYDAARPLIARRRQSASNPQATSSFMDHASYGGKVLAAGISHSLGNAGTAINHLRHTGENRVSLPTSNALPGLSCVTWITGKRSHALFVAGDGVVRTFPNKSRTNAGGKGGPALPRGHRYKDFKLKTIPDDVLAPVVKQHIDPDAVLDQDHQGFMGTNTLIMHPRPQATGSDLTPESSIPQAEIESSAPYQPFHTDRRVTLYEYGVESEKSQLPALTNFMDSTALEDSPAPARGKDKKKEQLQQQVSQPSKSTRTTGGSQAWAFGKAIGATKVDTGLPQLLEQDLGGSILDHRALPASAIERVLQVGENDEQIVVTTRRRRNGNRAVGGEEDGFFEDDCEVLDFADQRV